MWSFADRHLERWISAFAVSVLGLALTACTSSRGRGTSTMAALPPPTVLVTPAIQRTVPIYDEGVGQTIAVQTVVLRAQIGGTLERVLFKEGTAVKKGQTLFVIDQRPYIAALQSALGQLATAQANLTQALEQRQLTQAQSQLATAQGNLRQALEEVNVRQAQAQLVGLQATLANAQIQVKRDRYLVGQGAVAQQQLDNDDAAAQAAAANVEAQQAVVTDTVLSQDITIDQARASVRSAEAGVHDAALQTRIGIDTARAAVVQARAAVTQARLNLFYTTVPAPVDGIISLLSVDQGNLVAVNQQLATLATVDPIIAQFPVSEVTFLDLAKRAAPATPDRGVGPQGDPSFQLILSDGTMYGHPGTYRAVNNTVNSQSGTILVQALFPNPDRLLRPGMYARVRVKTEDRPNTVLVPQSAVQEVQGARTVFVVGPDNTVSVRTITQGGPYGPYFVVLNGLRAGERVIVEGVQKARPGSKVAPVLRAPPPLPTGADGPATPPQKFAEVMRILGDPGPSSAQVPGRAARKGQNG
jgi:membrane fusion protein, multidrug efflux system